MSICLFFVSSATAEQTHSTHFTSAKPLLSCNVQRSQVHDSLSLNFRSRNIQTTPPVYQVPIHVERTKVDLINDITDSA